MSAGAVAVLPTDEVDEKTVTEWVFQSLGEALYVAKAAGGNQVEVAKEVDSFQGKEVSQ